MSAQAEPEIATSEKTAAADRYPGAHPFGDTRLDRLRFRGRDEESDLLLHQLLGADLLVLFGKPGLGKTSLLNARLFPLPRDRDLLPLPVRFNQSDSLSPMQVFTAAIEQACGAERIDYTPGEDSGLWEFFKTAVFWREDRLQIPVLVLDQFEEIFTLQSGDFRSAAAAEIGELASRRVPDRLRQRLQSDEAPPFSERTPEVKVLVSLREDDLGMLQELTPQIPSILQNRFRLTSLNENDALRAITDPAELVSDGIEFTTKPFRYGPGTVHEIITAARRKEGGIDPFVLQLICSHVEKQVRRRQSESTLRAEIAVDSSYLGGEKGIRALTANFYLDAIERLPHRRLRLRARDLCEEGLLTENGRRRSVDKEKLLKEFMVDEPSLGTLEETRLLRSEPRHGTRYYEISHDRIAEAIHENRRWRMPRKLKRVVALALILGVALALFQWNETRFARMETERVLNEKRKAEELIRFLDVQIGEAFTNVPVQLRERLSDRLDAFYRSQGEPTTFEERVRRMSHHMRKAMVHLAAAERYKAGGFAQAWKDFYGRQERESAIDALKKALDHGEILAEQAPDDRGVTRDRIRSLFELSKVSGQRGRSGLAVKQLRAARKILDNLVQESPFEKVHFVDWMGLPNLDAAMGDLQAEAGDREAAHESYEKAMALQTELVARRPWDDERKKELERIEKRIEETAS